MFQMDIKTPSDSKNHNENMKFLRSLFFSYIIHYKILFVFLLWISRSLNLMFSIIYFQKHIVYAFASSGNIWKIFLTLLLWKINIYEILKIVGFFFTFLLYREVLKLWLIQSSDWECTWNTFLWQLTAYLFNPIKIRIIKSTITHYQTVFVYLSNKFNWRSPGYEPYELVSPPRGLTR